MTTRNPGSRMLSEAMELLQQAERMHRQFFGIGSARGSGPCWEPTTDIIESNGELSILVALPGVAPEKVNVVVDGGALYVVGERLIPAPPGGIIRRLEIPYGRFERRVDLPSGRFEIVKQELVHGCLLLTLHRLDSDSD